MKKGEQMVGTQPQVNTHTSSLEYLTIWTSWSKEASAGERKTHQAFVPGQEGEEVADLTSFLFIRPLHLCVCLPGICLVPGPSKTEPTAVVPLTSTTTHSLSTSPAH